MTVTASGNIDAANVNAVSGVTATTIDATTITATGNVSGGNLVSAADVTTVTVTASGNVDAANVNASTGVTAVTVTASGNVDAGNLTTAGDVTTATVTASGNVDAGNINVVSGVYAVTVDATTITATGNVDAGNLTTSGDVTTVTVTASGNVDANNLVSSNDVTTVTVTASGNITGGNISTAGQFSADTFTANSANIIGNISGGNLDIVGDVFVTGNVFGGNVLTANAVSGNFIQAGETVSGNNAVFSNSVSATLVAATGNVNAGNIEVIASLSATSLLIYGNAEIQDNLTVVKNITGANLVATDQVIAANIVGNTGITISTTTDGNIVLDPNGTGNIILSDQTADAVVYIGANQEVLTTANLLFNGENLTLIGQAQFDDVVINGADITSNTTELTINAAGSDINFRVSGDTNANLLFVDAGADTVIVGSANATVGVSFKIDTNDSIMVPVGNTGQRPAVGELGMIRYNTSLDQLEFYDINGWSPVGSDTTVISSDQFNGDGSTVTFTLSSPSTSAGTVVSINGIVQIPITSYGVVGNVLTFTEAPETTDVIDARIISSTASVASIRNTSGNAQVSVTDLAAQVNITGNLVPSANMIYTLGTDTHRWNDIYLSGNSIFLGNVILKESAGNLRVRNFDDTADAVVEATFVATSSTAGNIQIGDNHIESTNVNGEINLRPNGIGNVELESATIQVGKQNANVVVTSFGTGNLVFAVNASNVIAVTTNGIENRLANGVGNIGSATGTFDTVFAKATSAQYADLAEMYAADAAYAPGTVVSFGGDHEVTASTTASDNKIAGVISTNPSYIMNSILKGEHVVAVALTGRVPTQVLGPVRKGDMMVSAGNGHACASSSPAMGTVIGKALENFDGVQGVIEIVVGRL